MTGQTDFRLPLIAAYGDRLSVMPGEVMRIMVSTEAPSYRAQVVRLVGGETARDGTGFQEEPIEEIEACTYPGRIQSFRLGSYVSVPSHPALNLVGSFTIQLWIQPTTPDRTRQAVLSRCDADGAGYTLEIDPVYGLVLTVGGLSESALFATHVPLEKGRWYFVAAVIDLELHEVRLVQRPTPEWPIEATAAAVKYSINSNVHAVAASSGRALLLAGTVVTDPLSGSELIGRCFNGRLDRPRPRAGAGRAPDPATVALCGTRAEAGRLNVHLGVQGVLLDELAAGLDQVAHQAREHVRSVVGMVDPHLQQGARLGVEGGLPQLVGVHLAQALVALDGQALAAGVDDRRHQVQRPAHGGALG